MMGERLVMQESLFYEFRLEDHVPSDHLLRRIDRFVDCSGLRQRLAGFYSTTGRPSIDPELMIRMLLIGYCLGIRSERRLCEDRHCHNVRGWPTADGPLVGRSQRERTSARGYSIGPDLSPRLCPARVVCWRL